MPDGREEAERRRWADIVVIVAGVYAFLMAVFGPRLAGPARAAEVVAAPGGLWVGTGIAGILAIAGVILALRWTLLARMLTGTAGIVLIATLFAFERVGWLGVVTLALPALALLVATPLVGPMPSPEEEGRER